MLAPRERSQTAIAGVPTAARANQGAASISVKVSLTSVRHTKLDHSGFSPARIGPTIAHFARVVIPAAAAPAASITMPESNSVHQGPTADQSHAKTQSTTTPSRQETSTGTKRHSSHRVRAIFSPVPGL